jgi:DNA-binding IclR family transcriptional regulator
LPQSSPAIKRGFAILEFLAERHDKSFTLSEIARELDLNKATCLNLLSTLSASGYVMRQAAGKTYSIGPALIRLGHAATRRYGSVELARSEMEILSSRFRLECVASEHQGREAVVLARTGPASSGEIMPVGSRIPIAPPWGMVFVAWSDAATVNQWLDRATPSLGGEEREALRRALGVVRRRGYSLGLEGQARKNLGAALAELVRQDKDPDGDRLVQTLFEDLRADTYVLGDPGPGDRYRLNSVVVPVFGPEDTVLFALTLHGFPDELSAEEIPLIGEELLLVSARISQSLGGRTRSP